MDFKEVLRKAKELLKEHDYYCGADLMTDATDGDYLSYEIVKEKTGTPGRWHYLKEEIFKINNRYIKVSYSKPSTEQQLFLFDMEICEVEPKEKTITVYEPKREDK